MPIALELWTPEGAKVVDISTRVVLFHAAISVVGLVNPSGSVSVPGLVHGTPVYVIVTGLLSQKPIVTISGTTVSWSGTPGSWSGVIWIGTF